jgi:hypothetical protein
LPLGGIKQGPQGSKLPPLLGGSKQGPLGGSKQGLRVVNSRHY